MLPGIMVSGLLITKQGYNCSLLLQACTAFQTYKEGDMRRSHAGVNEVLLVNEVTNADLSSRVHKKRGMDD